MFKSITQKKVVGLSTKGRQKRTTDARICKPPYSFSAFMNRSEMIPVIAGINIDEIPIVEKITPNSAPDHCLFWNQ